MVELRDDQEGGQRVRPFPALWAACLAQVEEGEGQRQASEEKEGQGRTAEGEKREEVRDVRERQEVEEDERDQEEVERQGPVR